jgi:hypothetical protein
MDQDRFMDGKLSAGYESFPDRTADQRQAGSLQMADIARLALDQIDIDNVVLRIGAGATENPWRVVDLVARLEFADVRPLLLDHAGNVVTDDGGERHVVDVVATPDLVVQGIDGRGVDAHPDLSRSDSRHGNVPQLERIIPTEICEDDCLHGVSHDLAFLRSPEGLARLLCLSTVGRRGPQNL